MLPGTAELCSRTRARWSAGYRAPEQQAQDLEGKSREYPSVHRLPSGESQLQNRGKERDINCSTWYPLPHPSYLEADTGEVLTSALEGRPRVEGKAAATARQ